MGAANPRRTPPAGLKKIVRVERIARALARGPLALGADDKLRLLGDNDALKEIGVQVELRHAHPAWWSGSPEVAAVDPETVHAALPEPPLTTP